MKNIEKDKLKYTLSEVDLGNFLPSLLCSELATRTWFKVAVLAADSAGTETDRSRYLGSVSGETRKMLHRKFKKF